MTSRSQISGVIIKTKGPVDRSLFAVLGDFCTTVVTWRFGR
nr:MAG TPA: hypothetical protein [Caudoviricetes sp.]